MPAALTAIAPQDALQLLDDRLDLADVLMKLANPEEGETSAGEMLDVWEQEYRRFLALRLAHPDAEIVPCKIVDEMWHRHILDTAAYREDCDAIFGHFVDHFPYFGMRDEQDAQDLTDAYALTLDLYADAFGTPPPNTWTTAGTDLSRCRTACKPQRCK